MRREIYIFLVHFTRYIHFSFIYIYTREKKKLNINKRLCAL